MSEASKSPGSRRWSGSAWLSTTISVAIVAAFAAFFLLRYEQVRKASFERGVRLLVTGAEALRQAGSENATLVLGSDGCQNGVRVVSPAPSAGRPNEPCVRFSQLLGFIPKSQLAFDKTLVVGSAGAVLEQTSSLSAPSLLSLGELTPIGSDGKSKAEHVELGKVGSSRLVETGSERFQLFCQPVTRAARSADGAATPLHLCGLLSEARLLRDCLSVSPLYLMLLAGVLSLVLLVPPFVKNRMLSFAQRIRFIEAFTISLSLLFWLMLLTLLGEGFYTHASLKADASEELRTFTERVASAIELDVEAGAKAVGELAWVVEHLPGAGGQEGPPVAVVEQPAALPEIEAVAWSDASGVQLAKWSSPLQTQRGREPNLVWDPRLADASNRPYFKRALRRPSGSPYVDSVKTFTSGQTRAVFAERLERVDGVLAMTTELAALRAARLPAGLGFAVVDKSGAVLFHSEDSLSNSHNLFEETENDEELRRSVLTEKAAFIFDLRYFGVEHYGYVQSLAPSALHDAWAVVAFRESEPLRLVTFRAVVSSLLVSAGYAAVCVLVLLAYLWLTSGRVAWLWPDKRHTTTYAVLAVLQLGLGAAALLVPWQVPGLALPVSLLLPLALGVLAAAAFQLEFQERVPPGMRRWLETPGGHWRAYAYSFAVFWMVSTFVPTHALARNRADALLGAFRGEELAKFDAKLAEASAAYLPEHLLRLLDAYAYSWSHASRSWELSVLMTRFGGWAPALVFCLVGLAVAALVPWGMRSLFLWGIEAVPAAPRDKLGSAGVWLVSATRLEEPELAAPHLLGREDFDAVLRSERDRGGAEPGLVSSARTPDEMLKLLPPEASAEERQTWANALARYRVAWFREPLEANAERRRAAAALARRLLGSSEAATAPPSLAARQRLWRLRAELGQSARVLDACGRNLCDGALDGIDELEALRRIRDACWSYYAELWANCSPIEKLTLLQLAEERFVNDKRVEVVRRLLARGVIRRRPMLAPLNESFALFVRAAGAEEGIARMETRPDGFSWSHLRAPLVTLFVCSAAAFFYTQRALFDSTLVFATSLTGLLPHLGGLLAALGVGASERVADAAEALGA